MQGLIFLWINDWNGLGSTRQVLFLLALVSTLLLLVYIFSLLFPRSEEESDEEPDSFTPRMLVAFTIAGWISFSMQVLDVSLIWSISVGLLAGSLIFLPSGVRRTKKVTGEDASVDWVACTGRVSRSIPPHQHGSGKVCVIAGSRVVEWDAVTSGVALKKGDSIRVVGVIGDQRPTMIVEPITSSFPSQK